MIKQVILKGGQLPAVCRATSFHSKL